MLAGPVEFEEADLTKMPPSMSTPDVEKKEFPITLFPMLEKPKKEGGGRCLVWNYVLLDYKIFRIAVI